MVSGARLKKTQRSSCMKQQSQWIKGKIWVSALYTSWTALLTHQVKKEGVSQSTWYSVVASRVAVLHRFSLFLQYSYPLGSSLLLWFCAPALPSCLSSSSFPHIHSSSVRADQTKADIVTAHLSHSIFSSPRFLFSPSHRPQAPNKKNQKKIFSLHLECGHWVCQLLSLRILLLIFFLLPH